MSSCNRIPIFPPSPICGCVEVKDGNLYVDGVKVSVGAIGAPPTCVDVLKCLTPGSIPPSALAPGPLPAGVTVSFPAPSVSPTGQLSIAGSTIQLQRHVSSLGTPLGTYGFPA